MKRLNNSIVKATQWLMLSLLIPLSSQANNMADVQISVTKAAGDVYMLKGAGGNIGVLATEEGLLLVDDQFKPLAKKIEAAMKGIADNKLKYIVNTHYHGDHTGGNGHFGQHAPIFAHENVRIRLETKEGNQANELPVVTYQEGVNIYLEKEQIQLTHLPSGHTDGDTVVYFKNSNVLHTGDLFFEIGFPYVDLKGGGSVKGYLNNVNAMLAMIPDDVVIIPGHGKLTDKAGLSAYAVMLQFSIERVQGYLDKGMTQEQIIEAGIGDKYKHLSWSFINEEKWLKTLVADLK